LPPSLSPIKTRKYFSRPSFNADDRKQYGNQKAFRPLIDELQYYATEGITCNGPEGPEKVFIVPYVTMGDNKGLMEINGYVESATANYPCRTCKAPLGQISTMLEEDATLMRTDQNYEQDVRIDNMTATGIKERSVFTEIPGYEMPTDVSVDIFHDGPEGICHYTMLPVLNHFQAKDPSFLDLLNLRM